MWTMVLGKITSIPEFHNSGIVQSFSPFPKIKSRNTLFFNFYTFLGSFFLLINGSGMPRHFFFLGICWNSPCFLKKFQMSAFLLLWAWNSLYPSIVDNCTLNCFCLYGYAELFPFRDFSAMDFLWFLCIFISKFVCYIQISSIFLKVHLSGA